MPEPLQWTLAGALAYLVGSIPFGLLIGLSRGVDLRAAGSGNIGATNCGRLLGRKFGVACFFLDAIKGLAPTLAAGWWFGLLSGEVPTVGQSGAWLAVMAATVSGHIYCVWLGFKGGKGVATGFGAVLGIWPYLTLPAVAALCTWLCVLAVGRYVSLASVCAALAVPVSLGVMVATVDTWALDRLWPQLAVAAVLAALVVWRHRENLGRIAAGTEHRVGTSQG